MAFCRNISSSYQISNCWNQRKVFQIIVTRQLDPLVTHSITHHFAEQWPLKVYLVSLKTFSRNAEWLQWSIDMLIKIIGYKKCEPGISILAILFCQSRNTFWTSTCSTNKTNSNNNRKKPTKMNRMKILQQQKIYTSNSS